MRAQGLRPLTPLPWKTYRSPGHLLSGGRSLFVPLPFSVLSAHLRGRPVPKPNPLIRPTTGLADHLVFRHLSLAERPGESVRFLFCPPKTLKIHASLWPCNSPYFRNPFSKQPEMTNRLKGHHCPNKRLHTPPAHLLHPKINRFQTTCQYRMIHKSNRKPCWASHNVPGVISSGR